MGRGAWRVFCVVSGVVFWVALVLAGCSKDDDGAPAPPPTAAPVTPPSSTVDPTGAPTAQLLQDPAYWNAVLGRLNNIAGNAIRSALSTGKVEPRQAEAVRQVYGSTLLTAQQQALAAAANGNTQGLPVPPGDALITVQRVIKADVRCAVLDAFLDNKALNPALPSGRFFVRLLPRELREPRLNPTPWAIDAYFNPATGDGGSACP